LTSVGDIIDMKTLFKIRAISNLPSSNDLPALSDEN